jgi:hypothetical protein
MKAVVWQGIGDIRLEDVAEPKIEAYSKFDQHGAGWIKVLLEPAV